MKIAEISWSDYAARLEARPPVVLLPIGSLEQHGPHSPLGSDEILTRLIAEHVAEEAGYLVAPSVSYGVRSQPRSGGDWHFLGTTSIAGTTLTALVRDLLDEFARHGVKRIVVFDTHYENEPYVIEAIESALEHMSCGGITDVKIMKIRYFEFIDQALIDQVFPDGFPGWALEHAGVMTTSLHLYLTPELVDMSRAPTHGVVQYPRYDLYPFPPGSGSPTGCLNSPASATAEKGRLIHDHVVSGIVQVIAAEFG